MSYFNKLMFFTVWGYIYIHIHLCVYIKRIVDVAQQKKNVKNCVICKIYNKNKIIRFAEKKFIHTFYLHKCYNLFRTVVYYLWFAIFLQFILYIVYIIYILNIKFFSQFFVQWKR